MIAGFLIILIFNKMLEKRRNNMFIICSLMILVLDIADIGDFYLMQFPQVNDLRYLTSAAGYTCRILALVMIIDTMTDKVWQRLLIWIPTVINGVLAFLSCYNHWMFHFDSNNRFVRGPIGYLPYMISAMFIVVLVYISNKKQKDINIREKILVYFIMTILVLSVAFEVIYKTKFLLPGAMILSCILYYILFYVQANKRDLLTGLLNRETFYKDAKDIEGQEYSVISMDRNCLKDINDSKGHNAGDRALCTLSDEIMQVNRDNMRVYRVGGDEFMVIAKNAPEKEIKEFIGKARVSLSKTAYMCSFGYAIAAAGENFDDVCNRADHMMYEDKKNYKHR